MKTYVITLSEKFPTTHTRKGQETDFRRLFLNGNKIHTIRANFPLWEKRIARLTAEDGVGIQELKLTDLSRPTTINGQRIELPLLAQNDGLSFNDWFNWFIGYDLSKPLAIIHFTKFRY